MKNKKLLALVMIAAMLLGAFAGCDSKKEKTETPEETTKAAETENENQAEAAEDEEETVVTTEETYPEPEEPVVTFSGDPDEMITITENSYYEGDLYYICFMEGCVVPGSTPETIELVINELEDLYGMPFEKNDLHQESDWRDSFCDGAFKYVNIDNSKVNIIVLPYPDDGSIEQSFGTEAVLFDCDLDLNGLAFAAVPHELAHVYRAKQSEGLGSIFEEGFAMYAEDQVSRRLGFANWDVVIYKTKGYFNTEYDDSGILADPEGEFIEVNDSPRDTEQANYQYGFRLIAFLMEEYGPDSIKKISENANNHTFEPGIDTNDELVIEIIKESTSDDVFERFAEWLPEGWDNYSEEYVTYMMDEYGIEV